MASITNGLNKIFKASLTTRIDELKNRDTGLQWLRIWDVKEEVINFLKRIKSKILLKITILVVIEIILIIDSFGALGSSLGNSINIAGKNRYLTANLLLQAEWIF